MMIMIYMNIYIDNIIINIDDEDIYIYSHCMIFCPFLDVIRPLCSWSPPSSSTIFPSFHQQSLYPIFSYYMSKILIFPFLDDLWFSTCVKLLR